MAKEAKYFNLAVSITIWTIAAATAASLILYNYKLQNPAVLPEYANFYQAAPLSIHCAKSGEAEIKFAFNSSEKTKELIPPFSVENDAKTASAKIKFAKVKDITKQFEYDQIIKCGSIESLDYNIENDNLVVSISRKNSFKPAQVLTNSQIAAIVLPDGGAEAPIIGSQKPAPDSAAFPAFREITFQVSTKSPMAGLFVYVNGSPANATSAQIAENSYSAGFYHTIEKDKEYQIKAVAIDSENRAAAASWIFEGQIPSQAILGRGRFKYLGWWGRITMNGVTVRQKPTSESEKLGSLSSANNVKILKEVFGQAIQADGNDYKNNLWYQIDGGKYPGGYVFSEYIAPISQPEAPASPQTPKNVSPGDYWIDVDLTKNVLTLFATSTQPVFATYISSGRDENPTEQGTYQIWYKLYKARMAGGPPLHKYKYDLKNIPWVMYYNGDYAIHGTYWHDRFGTPQSAGCTNLTQGDAKFIFERTKPAVPSEKTGIFSRDSEPGTIIFNHK